MKRKKISLTRESVLKSLENAGIKMERRNDHDGIQLIDDTREIKINDVFGIIAKPTPSISCEYICNIESHKQKYCYANGFANVG